VAQREDNERDRASARGVQATDKNADRAAVGRYRCDVVLAINMRKVDGWQTLATNLLDQPTGLREQ
jgi:hypothetical protein